MTPYELEKVEREAREKFDAALKSGGAVTTLLSIIFAMQSIIVRHLSDVEAEATLKRHHEGRDD